MLYFKELYGDLEKEDTGFASSGVLAFPVLIVVSECGVTISSNSTGLK